MERKQPPYSEPSKRRARTEVIAHAVRALTTSRASSPLATAEDFDGLLDYCIAFICTHTRRDLSNEFAPVRDTWQRLHASRVGTRLASDLKVLFLSGPEPLNDLEELASLGIPLENIWAIEGDKKAFRNAVNQLRKAGLPLKLHPGGLKDFFAVIPEQFDIVYFDACGPLFGGKPRTNVVLQELFLRQRMAPLSVLITNFAATPRDNEDEWVKRLSLWYAARFSQPVYHEPDAIERLAELDVFQGHVRKHLEEYYSDFASRFTIEFTTHLLPWWRVRALGAAKKAYFANDEALQAAVKEAFRISAVTDIRELLCSFGHAHLSPTSYPLLWFVTLAREHLSANDPIRDLLFKESIEGAKLSDAIEAASLVRNFFEGYAGWGTHNWQACSDDLLEVLHTFRWFDSEGEPLYRMFCDTPLPNLVVDLLMGVYGYPYHVNAISLRRISYRAKQTTMVSDALVLDQCRYLYDMVPTLPLFGGGLSFADQLLIRICMDLIRRHTHNSCWDLYRGAALAAVGEAEFTIHGWPEREYFS